MPNRIWASVALVAALLLALVSVIWLVQSQIDGDPVGSQDFVAYWSAFEVALDGGNPYDERELASSQQRISLEDLDEAQRFWNPPWTLVLMAPVLVLPFDVAVASWFVVGIAAASASVWAAWHLWGLSRRPLPPVALVGSLLFIPVLESLRLGQLSTVATATVLGGSLALHHRSDVLAGVLFGLVAVKPHTFLLVLFVVFVHVLRARRWGVAAGAVGSTAALAAASAALVPGAFSSWDPVAGAPTHWHTATLVGWLRAALAGSDGAPTWPLLVVPALALVATLPWAWRRAPEFDVQAVPTLLALSYLVAPYAWIFDAAALIPIQVLVLGGAGLGDGKRRALASAAVAIQMAALAWRGLSWTEQQHLVWLPVALLLLERWRVGWTRAKEDVPVAGAIAMRVTT